MRFHVYFVLLALPSLFVLSCADDTVVQTGQIIVRADENAPFESYETFTVVTADMVPEAPELEEDEQLFNEQVNAMIRDAMEKEPVCLTFVEPDQIDENDPPDLFAGNGLRVETEEGYYWECIGGWWWGWWGWYWDPCKWVAPVPVEWDVGSMLIPVGPPPEGEDVEPVFAGLAQSVLAPGEVNPDKVKQAVDAIFQRWPDQRTCPEPEN